MPFRPTARDSAVWERLTPQRTCSGEICELNLSQLRDCGDSYHDDASVAAPENRSLADPRKCHIGSEPWEFAESCTRSVHSFPTSPASLAGSKSEESSAHSFATTCASPEPAGSLKVLLYPNLLLLRLLWLGTNQASALAGVSHKCTMYTVYTRLPSRCPFAANIRSTACLSSHSMLCCMAHEHVATLMA